MARTYTFDNERETMIFLGNPTEQKRRGKKRSTRANLTRDDYNFASKKTKRVYHEQ